MIEWIIGLLVAKHFYDKEENSTRKKSRLKEHHDIPKEEYVVYPRNFNTRPEFGFLKENEDYQDII